MKKTTENWANGLRELADFAEQHPDLFEGHTFGEQIDLFAYTPEEMAEKTAMLGTSTKAKKGDWYCMARGFGPHRLELNIASDKFCERVQIGTKTVEKPDPEALKQVPTVEVEEPVYEWICPESVLAHGAVVKVEA